MVHWHAITNVEFGRKQTHKELTDILAARPRGAELVREFDALEQRQAA